MKIIQLLFLVFIMSCQLIGQDTYHYSRARIYLENKNIVQLLDAGINIDHGIHHKHYIENDFRNDELEAASQMGFRTEMLIPDIVKHYQDGLQQKSIQNINCDQAGDGFNTAIPQNFHLGSMGGYFTYQEMLDELDSMRAKYPNLITTRQIINPSDLTHQGRPIYWVRISDNADTDEAEPEAFYNALHHAREPLSLSQLIYFMWYLLENYGSDANISALLDRSELYFVPMINPDGYIYNENNNPNGGGMWRKNRRNNGNGTFGVDLNRNYGYNWAFNNQGSSGNSSSDTYRGPSAFSEPETRNIRDFSEAHDFKVCFNYHTYGNSIVYPWAYNGLETGDSLYYRTVSPMFTKFNNYIYGTGTQTVGYTSNGDADDWQYGEQSTKNKTMVYTPEVGSGDFGFWPPSSEITTICQSTLWTNLAQSFMLLNFGLAEENGPQIIRQTSDYVYFNLTRYGFENGNISVALAPLTSNIVNVGPVKSFSLNQLQDLTDSITINLSQNIIDGDSIRFILLTDNNNGIVFRDTITKIYGNFTPVITDAADNLNNWSPSGNGNWTVSFNEFYSPSSSITDSEPGNYSNNVSSQIQLSNPIDLSTAQDASLNFWAKWDIENDYDYVQVLAAGSNGVFSPLCGFYTNAGTSDQQTGEPLYDGIQSSWVNENMSLNDYLGENSVTIKFVFYSDQFVTADGFYFDDLNVSVLNSIPSSNSMNRSFIPLLGQSYPNPASEQMVIPFENIFELGQNVEISINDVLGRIMYKGFVNTDKGSITVDIGQWPVGTYFYRLIGEKGSSVSKQVSVQR